jgi:mono/diheme cytochrome c family protein
MGDEMMRRVWTFSVGVWTSVVVVCVATAAAQGPNGSAEARKMKNPVASNATSVAAGKTAYQKYCRFCHGAEGLGDGPSAPKGSKPSNLTDREWTRGSTDGEIFVVLRDGAGPKFEMKGFKGRMTDEDMWYVVNYIRSIAKK